MATRTRTPQSKLLQTLASIGLGILPLLVVAQTYVEPAGPPPQSTPLGRPALEFLNGTTEPQRKIGSLVIGESNGSALPNCTSTDRSGCARLCLGSDPTKSINDPLCISDWSELIAYVGGPFLHLQDLADLGTTPPNDSGQIGTNADDGFSAVEADLAYNQLISFMVEANGAVSNSGAIRAEATSDSHYAGQFDGYLGIQKSIGSAELCLNGSCIISWADAIAPPPDALRHQTQRNFSRQSGTVGLAGSAYVGSLVVGAVESFQPNFSNSAYTCGDGLCSVENESISNCSADCSI